jgi:hypothetical protein
MGTAAAAIRDGDDAVRFDGTGIVENRPAVA